MENNVPPIVVTSSEVPVVRVTKKPFDLSKLIIGLLVLVIMAMGATIYMLMQPQKKIASTELSTTEMGEITPKSGSFPTATPTTSPTVSPTIEIAKTANWKTYTDAKAGFSFKYPSTVLLNGEQKNATEIILGVTVEKVSDIPEEMPMRMGRNDAITQRDQIRSGTGMGIRMMGNINSQIETTYQQLEVCSVMFDKKITFYPGEYRVIIDLVAPRKKIVSEMPSFFLLNSANCGTEKTWGPAKIDSFEETLAVNKGVGIAQDWYNTFYTMIDTVKISN
jgi:hypothetical protein